MVPSLDPSLVNNSAPRKADPGGLAWEYGTRRGLHRKPSILRGLVGKHSYGKLFRPHFFHSHPAHLRPATMFHFQRNAKNRSRDLAALTLLLSIPILLLITAFYAVAAWNADSLNNPNNPHYVAPVLRSASSLSACLAPATTQIPDFTSTRLHMPMVLPLRVGYLTSLATLSGYVGELTIWGIIPTSACTPNAAALPSPNVNITHGSGVMGYSYTTYVLLP